MKLLYLTNSEWEEDYIIKDLCGNIKNLEVIFYNKENIDNLSKYAGEETILTINSLVNIDVSYPACNTALLTAPYKIKLII